MARNRIIPIFVPHLGCPYHCVFCNQIRIAGQEKPASAEDVHNAIEGFDMDDYEVAFYGGSFTAIPEKMQDELLGAASGFKIRLSTRPDAIDEAVLSRLRAYNVETIELGAQSLDDDVLSISRRGHTRQDVINASRLIKENGFKLGLQMMTGLPGDSLEKSIDTAKTIISLNPDCVRIYPTVIVRDTDLYDMWKRGEYREHSVDQAVEWCAKILPMFEKAGITVIRLGLNPTDDLSGGDAVGGAYHPALGELVRSRIMRDELEEEIVEKLADNPDAKELCIFVEKNKVSQAIGQHKCNIRYLEDKYNLQRLKILMYNN